MATADGAGLAPAREARRAALAAERTKRILDAAMAVFARRGYQRATTKEIAAEAGVAEGTIYNYFPGKRALLIALLRRLLTETLPSLQARRNDDTRTLLTAIIRDRVALFERLRPLVPVIVQELAVDEELRRDYLRQVVLPLMGEAIGMLQQRMASGDVRPLDIRIALPAIVGSVALTTIANEMLRQVELPFAGPPLDREQMIAGLVDFILHGLAGREQATGEA